MTLDEIIEKLEEMYPNSVHAVNTNEELIKLKAQRELIDYIISIKESNFKRKL